MAACAINTVPQFKNKRASARGNARGPMKVVAAQQFERRTALAAVTLLFAAPAHAGLNRKGNVNAYEEMMKEMKANNESLDAEKMFQSGGGACGPGYEMRVEKVIGASCVCTNPDVCEERNDLTIEERSFGKKKPGANDDPDLPFTIAFE